MTLNLESKEDQESNHQTEEAHSFGESKTENSVRKQLLFQTWVSGITDDQGTEHGTDSGSGSSNTNGGGTGSNKFGGGIDVPVDWGGSNVSGDGESEGLGSDELSGGHFIKVLLL